jgi:aspartyl-tRNA synthetase
VIGLNEQILIALVEQNYLEIRLHRVPFPVLTYAEAMETYGNDRPDIGVDKTDPSLLAFLWISDFCAFEYASEDNVV